MIEARLRNPSFQVPSGTYWFSNNLSAFSLKFLGLQIITYALTNHKHPSKHVELCRRLHSVVSHHSPIIRNTYSTIPHINAAHDNRLAALLYKLLITHSVPPSL